MKHRLIFFLKLSVSLALLALVLSRVTLTDLILQFEQVRLMPLLLALAALFVQAAISTLKWKLILASDGTRIPFGYLYATYLIGNFISLFLPTSFGGDIYRVYALRQYNLDVLRNTSSVLFDRLTGLFALMTIGLFAYGAFSSTLLDFRFVLLYGAGVVLFLFLVSRRGLALMRSLPLGPFKVFVRLLEAFARYKNDPKTLFSSLFLSFLFQNNIVWIVGLYALALNVEISLSHLYVFVPIVYLTEAIPISINGLGLREGAFVFFLGQAGVQPPQALAVALLAITTRYVFSASSGGPLLLVRVFARKRSPSPAE